MTHNDDASITMGSLESPQLPGVNEADMQTDVIIADSIKKNRIRRSSVVSSCPSTCSSSATSTEEDNFRNTFSRRPGRKSSLPRTESQEIIASLREELAQSRMEYESRLSKARAEAEHSHFLLQKLIEENQKIRKEANDAHAHAICLEEKVRQLSSTAGSFGWPWRGATQVMRDLESEVSDQDISYTKVDDMPPGESPSECIDSHICRVETFVDQNSDEIETDENTVEKEAVPMVTIQVPINEEASLIDEPKVSKSVRELFQQATSTSTTTESKHVTAEALLWESFNCSAIDEDLRKDNLTSHQRIHANIACS